MTMLTGVAGIGAILLVAALLVGLAELWEWRQTKVRRDRIRRRRKLRAWREANLLDFDWTRV